MPHPIRISVPDAYRKKTATRIPLARSRWKRHKKRHPDIQDGSDRIVYGNLIEQTCLSSGHTEERYRTCPQCPEETTGRTGRLFSPELTVRICF